MGIKRLRLDRVCPVCGKQMVRVCLKTMHLDDSADECPDSGCLKGGWAEGALRAMARTAALAENDWDARMVRDASFENESDHSDKDD